MQWRVIAETMARLEATTRRLEQQAILGTLFRQVPPDQIDRVVYLCQGQLAPPWVNIEFGLSERLLPRAIAQAAGVPEEQVVALYKQRGDLGLVAEEVLRGPGGGLTLAEVYTRLQEIAAARGAGAISRKVGLLADLLSRLSGLEAKYIVRTVQGRLRLGVGDATIMDALAEAFATKEARPVIERAYTLRADLGLVARLLATQGLEAVRQMGPEPGTPVLPALAERLPSAAEIVRKVGEVAAEPKYDGLRLQVHRDGERIWLFSRRLEDLSETFPEIVRAVRRQVRARRAILDGEALAYNPATGEFFPFQITVTRRRKYRIQEMEERYPLRLFAFDLLLADGTDYTPRPFRERRAALESLLVRDPDDPIQLTEQIVTADPEELERFFLEMVERGLEGIVAKRPDAPYHAGARNFNWIKLKRSYTGRLSETVDVVIVGYLLGRGKRAQLGIGSLIGAVYDPENNRFRTVAKIGSGLSEEEWRELRRLLDEVRLPVKPPYVEAEIEADVWVEPRYVVEVLADEITRSPRHTCGKRDGEPGYSLRFPRVVRIRFDRRPEDATTEAEILRLYEQQQIVPERA